MSTDAAPNDPIEERLQEVVIGEVESQTIVVADYDPVWPERFRQEEAKKEMLGRAAGFRTATCPLGLRSRPSVGVVLASSCAFPSSFWIDRRSPADPSIRILVKTSRSGVRRPTEGANPKYSEHS